MSNSTQYVHCRLCADFKSYDQLVDLEIEKVKKSQVLEKLSRLNLQVTDLNSAEDILPKTVCVPCMDSLFKAYHFILDVEIAQEVLKANLLVQDIKRKDIKVEVDNTLTVGSKDKETVIANLIKSQLHNDDMQELRNNPEINPNIKIEIEESNEFISDLEANSNASDLETTDIKDFEIDIEESLDLKRSREIEPKTKLGDNLHTYDFKKDFEVTVNGYQMEISSKLVLNKTCNMSNERDTTDSDELNIDLDTASIKNEIHSDSNINDEEISSPEIYTNTNIQTRKRKHSNCNDLYDMTEQEKDINIDNQNNALQCFTEDESYTLKINRPIVSLDEITIHNGSNNILIISPLSKSTNKCGLEKGLKIDVKTTPGQKEVSQHDIQMTVSELKTQDSVPDKSSTESCLSRTPQLKSSWDQYIWKCYDCKEDFDSVKSLISHTKHIHNCCGSYQCTNCIFFTSNLDIFILHVMIHKEHLSKICFKCNRTFTRLNGIQKHYASCSKSDHQCGNCHETFENKEELLKHILKFGKQKLFNASKKFPAVVENNIQKDKQVGQDQLTEILYICDLCGMLFMYKHFLIYHLQTQHKLYM